MAEGAGSTGLSDFALKGFLWIVSSGAVIHLDVLDRYRKTKVHFVDCLIAATAAAENLPVASFDRDFCKFTDVHLETQ